MATQTTKGYPYPEGTDPADVPADLQALAIATDNAPGVSALTQSEIDALAAGLKWAGRLVWNKTTLTLQISNGSTFADLAPDTFSNALPADVTTTGSAGVGTEVSRGDHVHALSSVVLPTGVWAETTNVNFSGITIGNGSWTERYLKLGRTVFAKLWIQFGSTTTTDGTTFHWVPVVAMRLGSIFTYESFGGAVLFDSDQSKRYTANAYLYVSGNHVTFGHTDAAAHQFVKDTVPFTWATGDHLVASVSYESAS